MKLPYLTSFYCLNYVQRNYCNGNSVRKRRTVPEGGVLNDIEWGSREIIILTVCGLYGMTIYIGLYSSEAYLNV